MGVCVWEGGMLVGNGERWGGRSSGRLELRCRKDDWGNRSNYGSVVGYRLGYRIRYDIGVCNKGLNVNGEGCGWVNVWVRCGIYYCSFESGKLGYYFNREVRM